MDRALSDRGRRERSVKMESSLCEKPERHASRRLSDHLTFEGQKQKVHSLVDKVSRRARCDAQPGEDPDCAHCARLRVSRIQNPTWERTVPPNPRSDQIQTESAESLCHSHTEVGGPIQGSDQGLDQEAYTSASGRIDQCDQPGHPRMGTLLLSLPGQDTLSPAGRMDSPPAVVAPRQAVAERRLEEISYPTAACGVQASWPCLTDPFTSNHESPFMKAACGKPARAV